MNVAIRSEKLEFSVDGLYHGVSSGSNWKKYMNRILIGMQKAVECYRREYLMTGGSGIKFNSKTFVPRELYEGSPKSTGSD